MFGQDLSWFQYMDDRETKTPFIDVFGNQIQNLYMQDFQTPNIIEFNVMNSSPAKKIVQRMEKAQKIDIPLTFSIGDLEEQLRRLREQVSSLRSRNL